MDVTRRPAASMVDTRPALELNDLAELLGHGWGIRGDLDPLPSERDQNVRVDVRGRPAFVVKIANPAEDPAFLDAQDQALERLGAAGLPVARLVPPASGPVTVTIGGRAARVRLVTWLDGTPVAELTGRPPRLPEALGELMGRVTGALDGFTHPGADRPFQWDVRRASETIARGLAVIEAPDRRALLQVAAERVAEAQGRIAALRSSVIHNDANDHNVLVDGAGRVAGLLDLGDMVWSVTAAEPAVAAAYLIDDRGAADVIRAVLRGFGRTFPLAPIDQAAVADLVLARVAISVAISAHQASLSGDPYLRVSEAGMWRRLEGLVA